MINHNKKEQIKRTYEHFHMIQELIPEMTSL